MRISFLHTIEGNKRIFEDAAKDLGLPTDHLHHEVRSDLREAVQRAGTFSAELMEETTACLLALAADADVVILTCATLGPAADKTKGSPIPIVRADAALAAAATKMGDKVVVLCAVESAIEPTKRLFAQHASETAAPVQVVHVEQVWTLFTNNRFDECFAAIATAADDAYAAGATVVAYAHPWMAPAVHLARKGTRPLDSAHAALRTAIQLTGGLSSGI
jgi:hypothetical protein